MFLARSETFHPCSRAGSADVRCVPGFRADCIGSPARVVEWMLRHGSRQTQIPDDLRPRRAPCAVDALPRRGGASRVENLYRAQTIVTGQGEESRAAGFAEALEEVLVKVSGDPRLIGDPRVAELLAGPAISSATSAIATAWRAFRSMTSRARAIGPTTSPFVPDRRHRRCPAVARPRAMDRAAAAARRVSRRAIGTDDTCSPATAIAAATSATRSRPRPTARPAGDAAERGCACRGQPERRAVDGRSGESRRDRKSGRRRFRAGRRSGLERRSARLDLRLAARPTRQTSAGESAAAASTRRSAKRSAARRKSSPATASRTDARWPGAASSLPRNRRPSGQRTARAFPSRLISRRGTPACAWRGSQRRPRPCRGWRPQSRSPARRSWPRAPRPGRR